MTNNFQTNYRDVFGRQFKALRVSLTQACDFSCVYCVPDNQKFRKLDDELTVDEFYKVLTVLHRVVKLDKVRITGGEPLLYSKFDEMIAVLGNLNIDHLSITTNGSNMEKKAKILWDNHFRSINFSFDSLDKEKFAKMSRGGKLQRSMRGVEKALEYGFKLKFNMVPMKGYNDDELIAMLDFCLEHNIELRYIELMRMGNVNTFFDQTFVSKKTILDTIATVYSYKKLVTPPAMTAELYEIENRGRFGIIANESSPFCRGCDRLRLTSNGKLYGCISSLVNFDARAIINLPQEEADEKLREMLIGAMKTKQLSGFVGASSYMRHLGG